MSALLMQAVAAGDTLFVRQVGGTRSTLENLADLSTILIALVLIGMIVALLLAFRAVRRSQTQVIDFVQRLRGELTPIIQNVNLVSANISSATEAVREQIEKVDGTVAHASARLRDSVDIAHNRVRELDALLGVAQEEAEELFVSASSTLRGFQRGAGFFGRKRRREAPEQNKAAEAELDREYDGLWDDEIVRPVNAEGLADGRGISAEQGPTIHRRRSRPR